MCCISGSSRQKKRPISVFIITLVSFCSAVARLVRATSNCRAPSRIISNWTRNSWIILITECLRSLDPFPSSKLVLKMGQDLLDRQYNVVHTKKNSYLVKYILEKIPRKSYPAPLYGSLFKERCTAHLLIPFSLRFLVEKFM